MIVRKIDVFLWQSTVIEFAEQEEECVLMLRGLHWQSFNHALIKRMVNALLDDRGCNRRLQKVTHWQEGTVFTFRDAGLEDLVYVEG